MPICQKCGSQILEGSTFCGVCGTPVAQQPAAQPPVQPAPQYAAPQYAAQPQYPAAPQYPAQPAYNPKDFTAEFDAKDIAENKGYAILSYLSWLVVVPMLGAKESKFARFHAGQGLVLAILELICWFVFSTLTTLFSWIPMVGYAFSSIFAVLNTLCTLFILVFAIIGFIDVARGKAKELPLFGKFRLMK